MCLAIAHACTCACALRACACAFVCACACALRVRVLLCVHARVRMRVSVRYASRVRVHVHELGANVFFGVCIKKYTHTVRPMRRVVQIPVGCFPQAPSLPAKHHKRVRKRKKF